MIESDGEINSPAGCCKQSGWLWMSAEFRHIDTRMHALRPLRNPAQKSPPKSRFNVHGPNGAIITNLQSLSLRIH